MGPAGTYTVCARATRNRAGTTQREDQTVQKTLGSIGMAGLMAWTLGACVVRSHPPQPVAVHHQHTTMHGGGQAVAVAPAAPMGAGMQAGVQAGPVGAQAGVQVGGGVGAQAGVQAGPVGANVGVQVGGVPMPIAAPMPPAAPVQTWGPVGVGVPGQSWVEGHYDWLNGQYRWIPGHWDNPPQQGWGWQQPAWQGNQWMPGFWRAPTAAVPPAYEAARGAWNPGGLLGAPPTQTVIVSPNGVLQGVQQVVPLMR
jgi:hypothetical protein